MTDRSNSHPLRDASGVTYADARSRDLLAGRLEELASPPADWQQVKKNVSRTVWRGHVDGRAVYLKHYHGRSLWHRLRRLLGRSDALREMRFALHLRKHEVRAPLPLGACFNRRCEWLLTEAVEPAVALNRWHREMLADHPDRRGEIQPVLVAAARLIGRMHRAGVAHWDLHTGNILMRTDRDEVRLVLIDLHRMSRRRRLSRRAMAMNLAQLFHDRADFTTRTERLRFLKHYLEASGNPGTLRGWQMLIEDFARRHTARQHDQRDRRIFGRNRYFTPIEGRNGWRGHAVLASKRRLGGSQAAEMIFREADWRELLAEPAALLESPDAEVVKESGSTKIVRRRLKVGPREVDVFIKRPRRKRLLKCLVDCFRMSRSMRAFKLGHMLLTRRIATALPLAAMERRVGPFLAESILITETVDAPHLYDFMNTWMSTPPRGDTALSVPQQRQLAQEVLWQLGRMLQQLHDNFFSHRDLKATNIRVRWSPGHRPEIVLLDLDGLKQVHFITARRKFRGLMRLNVSLLQCPPVTHAGRLRMLLGYLRRPGSGRINFKPYWRVLEDWSASKLSQQIRSRRKRQKAARRPT